MCGVGLKHTPKYFHYFQWQTSAICWTWMINCELPKLTLSQTSPSFYMSVAQVLKTLWGKGENAHNEQFFLFPQCFLPIGKTFCHFHLIKNCLLETVRLEEFIICHLGKG